LNRKADKIMVLLRKISFPPHRLGGNLCRPSNHEPLVVHLELSIKSYSDTLPAVTVHCWLRSLRRRMVSTHAQMKAKTVGYCNPTLSLKHEFNRDYFQVRLCNFHCNTDNNSCSTTISYIIMYYLITHASHAL
jgi:hypothetical protein